MGFVEDAHWAVFDRYAAHIRTLDLGAPATVNSSSYSTATVHPAVYSFFCSQHPHRLFPTLRHFIVADTPVSADVTAIAWNVLRDLETLDIGEAAVSNTGFIYPFLQALGKSRLKTIRLSSQRATLGPEVLRLLAEYDLESLNLNLPQTHLSGRLLASIASMKNLNMLALHVGAPGPGAGIIPRDDISNVSSPASGWGVARHKLSRFYLTGSPSRMLRVLQHMVCSTLQSLDITEAPESSPQQTIEFWSACFEGLALVAPSLHSIRIRQLPNSTSLSPAILSPLFSLRSLRSLRITADTNNWFQMTDAEFASMIGHLSQLETLELGVPLPRSGGPTFLSLVYLAQVRPCNLKVLHIGLTDNCMSKATFPELQAITPAERSVSPHTLCIKSLAVGSSTTAAFDDVLYVAQLLHLCFPELIDVQVFPATPFCTQTEKVYRVLQKSYITGVSSGGEKSS